MVHRHIPSTRLLPLGKLLFIKISPETMPKQLKAHPTAKKGTIRSAERRMETLSFSAEGESPGHAAATASAEPAAWAAADGLSRAQSSRRRSSPARRSGMARRGPNVPASRSWARAMLMSGCRHKCLSGVVWRIRPAGTGGSGPWDPGRSSSGLNWNHSGAGILYAYPPKSRSRSR